MIKRCTGYKLLCDACGARLGGIMGSKANAQLYAAGMGYTSVALPYHFCSSQCKNKLEKQIKQEAKGGEDAE